MFTTHWIGPAGQTTLGSREWLPLPPTDYCFYPMVNSWLVPHPLDADRFKTAVAQALCIWPLNAAELRKHPQTQQWQMHLSNRQIPIKMGTSARPGPFSSRWAGEKDPDYYQEMARSGADLACYADGPLCKLLITTYEETGETSIMLTQSYNLGDGYCVIGFIKAIAAYYLGVEPDFIPTFEKYLIPQTQLSQSASFAKELSHISWLTASFSNEEHDRRNQEMHDETTRVEVEIPAAFVDEIKQKMVQSTGIERLSRGDAFSGYIASILIPLLGPSISYLQQCVGYRTQSLMIGKNSYKIPLTTMGTCYMICTTNLADYGSPTPSSMTRALYDTREIFRDDAYMSRVYAMYDHLYNMAALSRRAPFDCGHQDGLAFNNCTKLDFTSVHFGAPGQTDFIEWEVLENFVQFQNAGPRRQADGTFRQIKGDLTLVTRLKHHIVPEFLRRLEYDTRDHQHYQKSRVFTDERPVPIRAQL